MTNLSVGCSFLHSNHPEESKREDPTMVLSEHRCVLTKPFHTNRTITLHNTAKGFKILTPNTATDTKKQINCSYLWWHSQLLLQIRKYREIYSLETEDGGAKHGIKPFQYNLHSAMILWWKHYGYAGGFSIYDYIITSSLSYVEVSMSWYH